MKRHPFWCALILPCRLLHRSEELRWRVYKGWLLGTKYHIFRYSLLWWPRGQYNKPKSLWAYCPDHFVQLSLLKLFFHVLFPFKRQPEVNQLYRIGILIKEEEVLRLEISVGNFLLVTVFHSVKHLLKDIYGIAFRKVALFTQPFKQFSSFAVTKLVHFYSVTT